MALTLNTPPKGTLDYDTLLNENFQRIMDFTAGLANVATSGNYTDLLNKPKISKNATLVIGTTTSGHTENDVDYLCTGSSDQAIIDAAIAALPAGGGKIAIREGTYNIEAPINVSKDGITISGMGNSTILKRMKNYSGGLLTLNTSYNQIQYLQIDGNKEEYSSTYNHGIRISQGNNNVITKNIIYNHNYGIYDDYGNSNNSITNNICNYNKVGIFLNAPAGIRYISENTITENICNYNEYGIWFLGYCDDNIVTKNICKCNIKVGISLVASCNNAIIGNILNNNEVGIAMHDGKYNTLNGNVCNDNNAQGIIMRASSNFNTITGNSCRDNRCGIYLMTDETGCSNNTIIGNTCTCGNGLPTDYTTGQSTIYLYGDGNNNNLISNNNIMGKNCVSEGGIGNTFVNNKFE